MLCKNFFEQPTVTVAQNLIGTTLVYQDREIIITETEGYVGEDDPACHAAKGRTKRTEVMFGPAGITYVYLIYGMYHCLNIVTKHRTSLRRAHSRRHRQTQSSLEARRPR